MRAVEARPREVARENGMANQQTLFIAIDEEFSVKYRL
jgi:hypothetical protein